MYVVSVTVAPSSGASTEQRLSNWKGGGTEVKYLFGKVLIFDAGDVSDSDHMRCCTQHLKWFLFLCPQTTCLGKHIVFCSLAAELVEN